MEERKYSIRFITVEDRGKEIVRELARNELEKVLSRHGAVSYNLDDVLDRIMGDGNDKGLRVYESVNAQGISKGLTAASGGIN